MQRYLAGLYSLAICIYTLLIYQATNQYDPSNYQAVLLRNPFSFRSIIRIFAYRISCETRSFYRKSVSSWFRFLRLFFVSQKYKRTLKPLEGGFRAVTTQYYL